MKRFLIVSILVALLAGCAGPVTGGNAVSGSGQLVNRSFDLAGFSRIDADNTAQVEVNANGGTRVEVQTNGAVRGTANGASTVTVDAMNDFTRSLAHLCVPGAETIPAGDLAGGKELELI